MSAPPQTILILGSGWFTPQIPKKGTHWHYKVPLLNLTYAGAVPVSPLFGPSSVMCDWAKAHVLCAIPVGR